MRRQVEEVKSRVLPECGFGNVFYQDGYEADDLIASVVRNLPGGDEAVVVSADKDLLQLLADGRVCVWDPNRKFCHTERTFRQDFGLDPADWRRVKAIAGCSTDDVPGCARGLGEKTAAKFLRGELAEDSRFYETIQRWLESAAYRRNLSLVTLPLPGLTECVPAECVVDSRGWNKMAERFGLRSLKGKAPGQRGTGFGIRPKG
jgi:hypothetical protein